MGLHPAGWGDLGRGDQAQLDGLMALQRSRRRRAQRLPAGSARVRPDDARSHRGAQAEFRDDLPGDRAGYGPGSGFLWPLDQARPQPVAADPLPGAEWQRAGGTLRRSRRHRPGYAHGARDGARTAGQDPPGCVGGRHQSARRADLQRRRHAPTPHSRRDQVHHAPGRAPATGLP